MAYPRTEIRKVENGYILQQGRSEYVFDNFIEAMVVLAENYDEIKTVEQIIEYCKFHSGEYWEKEKKILEEMLVPEELPGQRKTFALRWICPHQVSHIAEGDTYDELSANQKCDCGKGNLNTV